MSSYLEQNNLIKDNQFGFRRGRSTEQAATLFLDQVKRKVNDGKLVGSVFIDLSKAFDTLSHAKLLNKLASYGVSDAELHWFEDYLFNRSRSVKYQDVLSRQQKVYCGVPQGSILGPLLFIIFFNDFCCCLKHSDVTKYADDTVISVAGKDIFIIETRLSSDMQAISEWFLQNELILNLNKGKTEAMLFGTAKNLTKQPDILNVTYEYNTIKVTTSYKYLGVHIDQSINLNSHFNKTYKKASGRLRLLNKLRPMLNQKAAKSIYVGMILPSLTYCGMTNINQNKSQEKMLHSIHNRAVNIIGKNRYKIYNPLALNRIRICGFVRKCINGNVCSNFRHYFELSNHKHLTRNNRNILKLPKIRLEYARGSCYYMGAKLYNNLPLEIRKIENFTQFTMHLKNYYFNFYN